MVRRIAAILALALGLIVGMSLPAHAGGGVVINSPNSANGFHITHNWCGSPGGPCGSYAYLFPGQSSLSFWADTDGIMIPSGCAGFVSGRWTYEGGRWYKITDVVHSTITVNCYS
jgi:hypothetical protein